jgi:hypothetical protein
MAAVAGSRCSQRPADSVLMIPVSILVIGVPIALFVRVLLEIARRL